MNKVFVESFNVILGEEETDRDEAKKKQRKEERIGEFFIFQTNIYFIKHSEICVISRLIRRVEQLNRTVLRDMTPSSLVQSFFRFGGKYCFHLHGRRVNKQPIRSRLQTQHVLLLV
jgi:hypothetical protein